MLDRFTRRDDVGSIAPSRRLLPPTWLWSSNSSCHRVPEIFLKYLNIALHRDRKPLPVAPVVEQELAEICGACVMVIPMLREEIDNARVFGRKRYRPHFTRQAVDPTVSRGQQVIDGVRLAQTRNLLCGLGRNVMPRAWLSWAGVRLPQSAFPLRDAIQTISPHVSPFSIAGDYATIDKTQASPMPTWRLLSHVIGFNVHILL